MMIKTKIMIMIIIIIMITIMIYLFFFLGQGIVSLHSSLPKCTSGFALLARMVHTQLTGAIALHCEHLFRRCHP